MEQIAYPSIITDLADPDYRKAEGFSNSFLKIIAKNEFPALAKAEIDTPKESKALIFGRALHCAFGEPDRFLAEYITLPEDAPKRPTSAQIRSLTGKKPNPETVDLCAWWDAWAESSKGKETIDKEDFDLIQRMSESARSHPEMQEYLADEFTEFEVSAFAELADGTKLKCRADSINSRIIDLKSIDGIGTARIERTIEDHRYFMQHPFYMDVFELAGKKVDDFRFVFVDKNPPYITRVVELPGELVDLGRSLYMKAIDTAISCIELDYWPGPKPVTELIGISSYAMRKQREALDESQY